MMKFFEKSGNSFSRSNRLRPIARSTAWFLWLQLVLFLSLSTIAMIGASQLESLVDQFGWYFIGILFLIAAFLVGIWIAADGIRRVTLTRQSRQKLKARIHNLTKSYRYVVQRKHLRSAIVGAIFFATLAAISVIVFCLQWDWKIGEKNEHNSKLTITVAVHSMGNSQVSAPIKANFLAIWVRCSK